MSRSGTARETRVTDIRLERVGSANRVSADVDGIPLWFESNDSNLAAAPEAFGSALLLVSLHHRRKLVIDAPVSATWIENIRKLFPIWRDWWGYKPIMPDTVTRTDSPAKPSEAKALLFSGGVDSFYSVLNAPRQDFLVSIHGFDIPLADHARMEVLRTSVNDVAKSIGARSIVIRTNFREHPVAGRGPLWERSHGGVLAAIGHVLSEHAGELSVSSSYGMKNPVPWGSSFLTDPFFSSDRMRISTFGAEVRREQKIPAIAHDPLARKHLRVCWDNREGLANCSRCGKCLITMLSLAEAGALDQFEVFDDEEALITRLNETRFLWKHTNPMARAALRGKLNPRVADAAMRLVKRSRHARRLREFATRLTYIIDRYA
ncbi:MAG: hypothetical protein ABR582_12655 [Gemmatimonadaceae bacterium]